MLAQALNRGRRCLASITVGSSVSSYYLLANMQVQVRLFARYRELAGTGSLSLDVPENSTALEVFDHVAARYPDMRAMRASTLMAVDQEFVKPSTELRDGEELALMPPVSGGSAERVHPC
jgi:molybdopterin converting factor subunit 1